MTNLSNQPIPSTAMPVQTIMPLAAGASSPMQSAQMNQQLQLNQQMALIGTGGSRTRGYKKRKTRKLRGGATGDNNAQILVPSVQPGAVNPQQTSGQYAALTELASRQESQAVYDRGNFKGGKRLKCRQRMKGGMYPNWGCLSGGRRTIRKNRKNRKHKRITRNKRHHH